MTALLISPDYSSHYNPLSVLGRALARRDQRVVVATGAALRDRVLDDGFEWVPIALGPASNPGVAAADPAIARFLRATELGPVETIRHQAVERERDLLWEPERVAADIDRLVSRFDPATVVVDHVSFNSTLALHASGRDFVTVVPGHPTQLPVAAERYGVPPEWPTALQPPASDLRAVELLADRVASAFTERWNEALAALDPTLPAVLDAYRVHGRRVLYNGIAELQSPGRASELPASHRFVGPLVRAERTRSGRSTWCAGASERPLVYVALGTFLSHRGDVLVRVAQALQRLDVRAAIATGPTSPDRLGPIPDDWIVGPSLPQVALLAGAEVAIHHGGNNSVQEALAAGCRQIVLPFSTDQFAGAADLERRAGAIVIAPNEASATLLADATRAALAADAPRPVEPRGDADLYDAIVV